MELVKSHHHNEWQLIENQCKMFIESNLLPDHLTNGFTPKQAIARAITIAWKGRELGVPPLQALASISVIKGKPCLSSELMLSLIYTRCKGAKITFVTPVEKQHLECTVKMQRPDGDPQEFRFTIEDAKKAGLEFVSQKGYPTAWTKYPAAMLRARAISAGARAVFPDCIMGCYTPEEMGSDIIEVEGEVVDSHVEKDIEAPSDTKTVDATQQVTEEKSAFLNEKDFISERQIGYLYVVMNKAHWAEKHLKDFLKKNLHIESKSEIPKNRVQDVLKYIENNPL